MPNYQVLRCANDDCAKFQSQQQKKSNKWKCVVCGLTQSLKRVYFESSMPKECRGVVMEMNMNRGMAEAQKPIPSAIPSEPVVTTTNTTSKWNQYVVNDDNQETVSGPECELDKHNRVVVGRVTNEKKKQDSKATTQQSKNRYSPYSKPTNTTTVTTKEQTSSQPPKIAQALDKLPKPKSTPISTNVNKNSKWSKYAASDSEDSE